MLCVLVTNFVQLVLARVAAAVGESGCMPLGAKQQALMALVPLTLASSYIFGPTFALLQRLVPTRCAQPPWRWSCCLQI